jgi:hypothetical protein
MRRILPLRDLFAELFLVLVAVVVTIAISTTVVKLGHQPAPAPVASSG